MWRILVVLVCAAISIGGVHRAAGICLNDTTEAGRGGAVASIVAFAILFFAARRPTLTFRRLGSQIVITKDKLSAASAPKSPEQRLSDCEAHIRDLVSAMDAYCEDTGKEALSQNITLWIAAGIGTLFWGFGDLILPWWRLAFQITCR